MQEGDLAVKGWCLRIERVYFHDNLEYFSTFPISILRKPFRKLSMASKLLE